MDSMKGVAVMIPVLIALAFSGSLGFTALALTNTTVHSNAVSMQPSSNSVQPSTLPNAIVAYLSITVSNAKATAEAPEQEMITVNSSAYSSYEAPNLQNVEFFYQNGTIIPSWLETNASSSSTDSAYWLNMVRIPAKSQVTIFMGFALKGRNLFNGNDIGESPLLSPLYGQYDDGASVFEFYDNFAGSRLSPQWTSSGNVMVSNGLHIYSTRGVDSYIKSVYSNFSPINNTLEIYALSAPMSIASNYTIMGYNALHSPSAHALFFKSTGSYYRFTSCTDTCTAIASFTPISGPLIFGMYTGSSGASHGYQTSLGNEANPPTVYTGVIGQNFRANASISIEDTYPTFVNISVPFVRIRQTLPPDQPTPTLTFNSPTYLALNLSDQFFYGTNVIIYGHGKTDNFTLTGPAGHTIGILVNGNVVATSYNGVVRYPLIAAAGTYNITGEDLSSGNMVSHTYQILKANESRYSNLSIGNKTYNGIAEAGSIYISSFKKQLTANLLLNGTIIGSTNSMLNFSIGPAPIRANITLVVNGGQNYTNVTISRIVQISRAQPYLAFDMRSYNYNGSTETAYANVTAFGGQLPGTLYENGEEIGSSQNGSIKFTIGPNISRINFTFTTPGNANYTAASVSPRVEIYPDGNTLVPGVIKHVIIITQENHAFDNYFGTYPGAVGIPPGACEPKSLTNASKGCVAPFIDTQNPPEDMAHSWNASHWAWDNGKMDGFVAAPSSPAIEETVDNNPDVMATYNYEMIPYYWSEAGNYTLADNFFSAALSYSLPNHWFEIAANAPAVIMGPQFDSSQLDTKASEATYLQEANPIPTLADELLDANISWMYYGRTESSSYNEAVSDGDAFDYWEPLSSQNRSYTAEYLPHFAYFNSIFNSISNGTLSSVSWIVPNDNLSEHPPANITQGMWYTTDIVDAVANSSYWNSTLIIITWDEYGGYYDSVPPPIVNGQPLGFRVPVLIISPYSKTDFIDNENSSFMSTMKFIEWNWNLSAINGLDSGASNLLNAFYYNQSIGPTRPYVPRLNSTQISVVNREVNVYTNCVLCHGELTGFSNSTGDGDTELDNQSNATIDVNGYIMPASWFDT